MVEVIFELKFPKETIELCEENGFLKYKNKKANGKRKRKTKRILRTTTPYHTQPHLPHPNKENNDNNYSNNDNNKEKERNRVLLGDVGDVGRVGDVGNIDFSKLKKEIEADE